MPKLTLEYSSNIIEKDEIPSLLKECNHHLCLGIPTPISTCKSMAFECKNYCAGEGNMSEAFVHIHLQTIRERTDETLRRIGDSLMRLLQNHFVKSMNTLRLEITIEINRQSEFFYKYSSYEDD
ncbi:MAG: hypothetical protein KA998_04000 [Rickettsiaceae bacterium]|nr:hypothetical protein [Rickettsiaceae bacterium]